jgi:hypothetical protein
LQDRLATTILRQFSAFLLGRLEMKPVFSRVVFIACLLACVTSAASARQWVNRKTAQRFEGEFVRVIDMQVVILRAGRPQMVPMADLVDKDRDFVQKELEKVGKEGLVASPDSLRTWTDVEGRTNKAAFVKMQDRDVVLGNSKGMHKVPYEVLSPGDQEYVRAELNAQGKGNLIPADENEVKIANRADTPAKSASSPAMPKEEAAKPKEEPAKPPAAHVADAESTNVTEPTRPAAPPPTVDLASLGAESSEKKPSSDPAATKPSATTPPAAAVNPPAKSAAPPVEAGETMDDAFPAPAAGAPAKPAAGPAPPAGPQVEGYGYCSRCKKTRAGRQPGETCPGCLEPLDMFMKMDGTLVELEGKTMWDEYGTIVISVVLLLAGLGAFIVWKQRTDQQADQRRELK